MANLGNTSGLLKYVAAMVETFENSMSFSRGVPRGAKPGIVTLKNNSRNRNIINRFVSLATAGNDKQATDLRVEVKEVKRLIPIGTFTKPTIKVNMGDVAEGVFACAITARFINREVNQISARDVMGIIGSLAPQPILGRKSQRAIYSTTAPNLGVQVRDGIKLELVLGAANMAFVVKGQGLEQFVDASLQYANRQSVTTWVKTLYTNRRADRIEILGDGVSGQRSTKVDTKVKVTNDKGQLQPVNIDVSLKAGEVKQFGQVGGIEIQNLSKFFSNIFGVQVDSFIQGKYTQKTVSEKDVEGGLNYLYEEVTKKLNDINPSIVQSIANGIKLYATGGDENVELVQLSKGEATIYNFKDVGQKLAGLKYSATVTRSGTLPQITVSSDSKILISIRSKKENKKDSQGRPYTYFRNYIEKGPLLGELIARAAKDE